MKTTKKNPLTTSRRKKTIPKGKAGAKTAGKRSNATTSKAVLSSPVWSQIYADLARRQQGSIHSIERSAVPHPLDEGARPTVTWPQGQLADLQFDPRGGRAPLVVREYEERFEAYVEPAKQTAQLAKATTEVLKQVEANPKGALVVGSAIVGGALGASITNKREGTLVGAGLGLLFAVLLNSLDD